MPNVNLTTTRFVLLSAQRSGTSWLMERLAKHPDVGGYGELLLSGRTGWPDWPPGANDRPFFETYLSEKCGQRSRRPAHRNLFAFLDYVYTPRREFRAIGFKLMYDEAAPYPELLYYLRQRRVRVVHLIRTNLLDLALSQIAMSARRRAHVWSTTEYELVRVHVDTRYLMKLLKYLQRTRRIARALLRAAQLDTCEVSYESLVASDASLHRVLEFLGIRGAEEMDLVAKMRKLAPSSHREGIANFEEVERCLEGTRFWQFLRPYG